jgi:hypothetical protein
MAEGGSDTTLSRYDLGTLIIGNHDVKKLTQALKIIVLARTAWEDRDTISESIEYIAQNTSGSELVLALVFFGRIWEDSLKEEE